MSTASQMLSLAGRYSHVAQVHADPSALAQNVDFEGRTKRFVSLF